MVSASLAERLLRVKLGNALRDRAPLTYWHHCTDQSRLATRLLRTKREVYVRAANVTGKTEWATAVVESMLMKKASLDGEALPQWRGKVDAICLVRDYKQQKLSVQQTVLRLLGEWPHHARYIGDTLSSLRIKPAQGSDDEATWSTLTFLSQENRRAGLGARADIVWADEPPDEAIWREVRKAGHANRPMVRIISATPIIRRHWAWLKSEYGDCPRGGVREHRDWAEVRWGLFDVSREVLTDARKAELVRDFTTEGVLKDARIFGDYINEGGCPFDVETLTAMLADCVDAKIKDWEIKLEDAAGVPKKDRKVTLPVEIWAAPNLSRSYYVCIDPASGVDDKSHDPLGLHVTERGSGDLVARFNGYCEPYRLGVLAVGLARQYNNAQIDCEINDGWGVGVYQAVADCRYGNVARSKRLLNPQGDFANELGFRTNQETRAEMINAVQTWIAARRSGIRYGVCPSRRVIETLIDCVLDESGKPVAAPGLHDEDLILRGRSLKRTVSRAGSEIPESHPPVKARDADIIAAIQGRDVNREAPSGDRPMRPLARPKV